LPIVCPTREHWSVLLSQLPDTELDPGLVNHLDHCQSCWSMVGSLAAGAEKFSLLRGHVGLERRAADPADEPVAVSEPQRQIPTAFVPDRLPPGTRLGHLRLLSLLGHGAMGSVYLAVDDRCGRQVAVKCLHPARSSAEFISGLAREARVLSQLQHPNIVPLLEFNLEHDPAFLVLELAAAGSLRQALKHRTLNQQQSVQLMAAVARAVHAAHESGVLHLDLKPENILLVNRPADDSGPSQAGDRSVEYLPWIPKVADFGLCTSLHGEGHFAETWRRPRGTLAWMAPEQVSGQSAQLGRATDVYALGVILYELLTGVLPFRAGHDVVLSGQICRCPPCPPRELCPGISPRLNLICLRCLQKEPRDRFQAAAELADELDSVAARSLPGTWLRRPFRNLRQPRFTAAVRLQVLCMLAGFLLGAAYGGRNPLLMFSAAPQVSTVFDAMQLGTEIQQADRVGESYVLMAAKDGPADKDRLVAQFLWHAAIRPSRKLLSNPLLVQALNDRDPQTLLLARLYDVAGLAEDGQLTAAAAAWILADDLARQLHDRKLLNERLRWRGLIAARRMDRTLTRQNRSSEGLRLLEDAWKLFGPENLGQAQRTPNFTMACEAFQAYLLNRRSPAELDLTCSSDP
jgi:hypothetical protein